MFPKPLVALGFILIAAGLGAGIYDAFRDKKPKKPQVDMENMAKKSTDLIFKKLFEPFESDKLPEKFLSEFKAEKESVGITAITDRANRLKDAESASGAEVLRIEDELFETWEKDLHRKIISQKLLTREELDKITSETSDKEPESLPHNP